MRASALALSGSVLLSLVGTCEGALFDRGGGMIYDSDLDITWLQDANYAKTSGYDGDGRMSWTAARAWAVGLEYGGYADWRLPATYGEIVDGRVSLRSGYYDGGEMAHMYYVNLGNVKDDTSFNAGPFVNLQRSHYWSDTESFPYAWFFYFGSGFQGIDSKGYGLFAWAVRDGDSPGVVPLPAAIVLFGAGVLGLGGLCRRSPANRE